MAEFDESKHKRDDDGKFSAQGGGGAAPKEPKKEVAREIPETDSGTIEIKGNELGAYSDIKELRKNARAYFKEHLQGKTIEREGLGTVRVSRKGVDETITWSTHEDKLKAVPAVERVIKTGKIGEAEALKHPRKDGIVAFIPITQTIKLEGKLREIEVLLGKDRKGNLYYDLFLDEKRQRQKNQHPPVARSQNPRSAGVSKSISAVGESSIPQPEYEINIRFLDEADGAVRTVNDKPFNESKHKRDDGGKFSTQDGGGAAPKEPKKEEAREIPETDDKSEIVSRLKESITKALAEPNWQQNVSIAEGQEADPSGKLSQAFGFRVTKISLITDDVRHMQKRHGDGNEKYADQIGLKDVDYDRIWDVLSDPETYFRHDKSKKKKPSVEFGKKFPDGTLIVLEIEASESGAINFKSMWKKVPGRNHAGSKAYPVRQTSVTAPGIKNSITESGYEINIRFYGEDDEESGSLIRKYLKEAGEAAARPTFNTVNDKPFNESKHKRDDDGKFSAQGGGGAAPKEPKKEAAREIPETPSRPFSDYLAAHNGDHFEAARDFYRTELQGKKVETEFGDLGKKDVYFIGSGWKEIRYNLKKDQFKAELVSFIPEILRKGEYLGAANPTKEHDPYIEFHYFSKRIKTPSGEKHAIVDVGKRNDGTYEYTIYSINHDGHNSFVWKLAQLKRKGNSKELPQSADSGDDRLACLGHYASIVRQSNSAEGLPSINEHPEPKATASSLTSEDNITLQEGVINIFIVDEAGERPTFNQRIGNWRIDEDGMLRVTAHILREGIYDYTPEESPEELRHLTVVRQFIPAGAFTAEALSTLEGKWVVVNEHEWRDDENTMTDGLTVGSIAGKPRLSEDGKAIECDFLIAGKATAEAVRDGRLVEVSAGYTGDLDMTAGEYGGESYDAVQTNLRFNHVLLLPSGKGRCGSAVRIINTSQSSFGDGLNFNNKTDGGTMAVTFKTKIGNTERTLRFTNEEDAAAAESALEEERKFNAEALSEHIAGREEVQAKLDEAGKQVEELKAQLAEHDKHLSAAKAEIERLLTPAAQEGLARELNEQADDEESIVEVEAESESEEEKEKILNSIREGKTLAERRANAVRWHLGNRKIETPKDVSQEYMDGMFRGFAVAAKEKIMNRRAPNGNLAGKPRAANVSTLDRVIASLYGKRKEA